MHPLLSTLRRVLPTLALVWACSAAQAEVVRLRFDFGGSVAPGVHALFEPLLQPGDDYRAWFEIDYDRSFEGGPRAYRGWHWTTIRGEQRIGNRPPSAQAFYSGAFSNVSMQFQLQGRGEEYLDGDGVTHALDGPWLGMTGSAMTMRIDDLLALDTADVFVLGIYGFSYGGPFHWGYGRQIAAVLPDRFAVTQLVVPEPGALGLALAALALLAGLHRRGARPAHGVCQTAAHAAGRSDIRPEMHPA
jgi:hypothetical protein